MPTSAELTQSSTSWARDLLIFVTNMTYDSEQIYLKYLLYYYIRCQQPSAIIACLKQEIQGRHSHLRWIQTVLLFLAKHCWSYRMAQRRVKNNSELFMHSSITAELNDELYIKHIHYIIIYRSTRTLISFVMNIDMNNVWFQFNTRTTIHMLIFYILNLKNRDDLNIVRGPQIQTKNIGELHGCNPTPPSIGKTTLGDQAK
jgi:hypothetical protein